MFALRVLAKSLPEECAAVLRHLALATALVAIAMAGFGLGAVPAGAGEMAELEGLGGEHAGAPADTPERWSILDGKVFEGEFGIVGKQTTEGTDSWFFRKGMFASEKCIECGFPESPYWVAFGDDGTTFRARTQCPVSDAIITWRGTIKDGQVEGVYTWKKERWYWTIEKDFWFKGTLKETASDQTVSRE